MKARFLIEGEIEADDVEAASDFLNNLLGEYGRPTVTDYRVEAYSV